MEGILANREQCDKYPVLGESFEAYTRRRPEMLAPMLDSGKTGMFFMRVMPVISTIENDTRTASYDELKTLIENATAISVGPCSCRRARRLMGEGCGHLEEDMCMYLNDNAVCYSEQGYHRLVTKEEAYEILRRAEDNGLVHEINQTPGFEDATAICKLLRLLVLRAAHRGAVPHAARHPLELHRPRGQGKVRRLRSVRRKLPDQRAQARPEALHDRSAHLRYL